MKLGFLPRRVARFRWRRGQPTTTFSLGTVRHLFSARAISGQQDGSGKYCLSEFTLAPFAPVDFVVIQLLTDRRPKAGHIPNGTGEDGGLGNPGRIAAVGEAIG